MYSSESVEMCGQGELFLANDDKITEINKLLSDSGFSPLSSNLMRLHKKAIISGKKYSSRKNKRVKKQNSYTIKTYQDYPQYGLIEFFLSTDDQFLACIVALDIKKGVPYSISPNIITLDSQPLLFEDYFTYEEKSTTFVLAKQIFKKCINLSTFDGNLLTIPVNSKELE